MRAYPPGIARVLVVGEALVDVLRRPDGEERRAAGGGPSNVALGLGRLRVPTELLTHVAPDDDGILVLHRLIDAGVALIPGSLAALRTPTSIATISERGYPHYAFDVTWSLPRSTEFLALPELVHVGSYAAFMAPGCVEVLAVAERARRQGVTVTFDPNIRPALLGSHAEVLARFELLAGLATVVKLSDEDAHWLYPGLSSAAVVAHLLRLGATLATLTLGGDGSILATAAGSATTAATAATVVDTVGAGDSYMAALIHCLLHADLTKSGELEWIGRWASAAAALTVARPGADPPWLAELDGSLLRARAAQAPAG